MLTFRLISVPQLQGIRTGDDSLVSRNHEDEDCTAERCVFDEAWGPTDCNYITWNIAVCTYPLFISGDSAETTWQALREKSVSRNDSNSLWKTEGIWDCLEPSPTETGPKWIVKLRPLIGMKMKHGENWHRQHSTCTSEAWNSVEYQMNLSSSTKKQISR